MSDSTITSDPVLFAEALFRAMDKFCPAIGDLELYEFVYCLENVIPKEGWNAIVPESKSAIEKNVRDFDFFKRIEINRKVDGKIVLDAKILDLTRMLFVGLVTGEYDTEWLERYFYFDVRGFFFLVRTEYFTQEVLRHFDGKPYIRFTQGQRSFDHLQGMGYREFKQANLEVDTRFIEYVLRLIDYKKTPILLAIAGPTAAGKTEIVERLTDTLVHDGRRVTSIEMDNFLTDRDYREAHGIDSEGRLALHFDLLKQALSEITQGKQVSIPRYDFVKATSSHDISGNLKPNGVPIEVEPADIIFMEGNFPFLLEEIVDLIGIKIVYLTDDPVRLKRKWRRDMDYRKKYDLNYFRNRYFKDQFIMAQVAYIPQLELCDMAVDTTGAAIWVSRETADILNGRKAE